LYYLLIAPIDINAAKKRSSEPDMQGSFNELVGNLLGDGSQKLNDFLLLIVKRFKNFIKPIFNRKTHHGMMIMTC
jgi:hypothetical protein